MVPLLSVDSLIPPLGFLAVDVLVGTARPAIQQIKEQYHVNNLLQRKMEQMKNDGR